MLLNRLLLQHVVPHECNILRTGLHARNDLALSLLLSLLWSLLLHLEHLLLGYGPLSLPWVDHAPLYHFLQHLSLGTLLDKFLLRLRDELMIPAIILVGDLLEKMVKDYTEALREELLDLLGVGRLAGRLLL